MKATVKSALVEVHCAKCGRPERLTPEHIARLKAAGIEWTCTGTGCDIARNKTKRIEKRN
jgi:hypothetical protein